MNIARTTNRVLLAIALPWLLLGNNPLHLWPTAYRHFRVIDLSQIDVVVWPDTSASAREPPEGWFDPTWRMDVIGAEPKWIIGNHIYTERNLMGRNM